MMNNAKFVIEDLGFLTITANRLMSAYFRKRLVGAGINLTAEQWGVLAQLWERGHIAQDELAHYLCVDKSSLSRVLAVLERRALVLSKRDPADARRKILYPSSDTERFKPFCRQVAASSLEQILDGVTDEDLAVCCEVLKRVKQNLRKLSE